MGRFLGRAQVWTLEEGGIRGIKMRHLSGLARMPKKERSHADENAAFPYRL